METHSFLNSVPFQGLSTSHAYHLLTRSEFFRTWSRSESSCIQGDILPTIKLLQSVKITTEKLIKWQSYMCSVYRKGTNFHIHSLLYFLEQIYCVWRHWLDRVSKINNWCLESNENLTTQKIFPTQLIWNQEV